MARTIGVKNKNLVKKLTREEIKKATDCFGNARYSEIEEKVIERLPVELWDTWEMADSEIRRIISDEIRK